MPDSTLAEKVEQFTEMQAFVSKKLICCPPDDTLDQLMSDILPLQRQIAEECKEALS